MAKVVIPTVAHIAGAKAAEYAGEHLYLLPSRCVFWPRRRALLVADLHLGKEQTFQRAGLGVPALSLAADLARLEQALAITRATDLWILGDFIHHRSGLTEGVLATIARWRRRQAAVDMHLVIGNHDRASQAVLQPLELNLVQDPQYLEPFVLAHDFRPDSLSPTCAHALTGHLHPVVRFEEHTLPAFYFTETHAVVPAFSEFTGGVRVDRNKAELLFAIAERQVLQIK